MTPDELAKHGLRVKPLAWNSGGEERFRSAACSDHAVAVCAALERIPAPETRAIVGGSSSVEVCFECDISDCHHIRARKDQRHHLKPLQINAKTSDYACHVTTPARALLIAVLRALVAKEGEA